MRTNIHNYPYEVGDVGYVVSNTLTVRSGICTVSAPFTGPSTSYSFLMFDNNQTETFTYSQLYGTSASAEIAIQSKYITPTPSVSQSVSVTPTRTPRPSSTTTPTPSASPILYPNLFSGTTWNFFNGSVAVDSTTGKVSLASIEPNGNVVRFFTDFTTVGGNVYNFDIRYEEGTCQYATIELFDNTGTQMLSFSLGNPSDISNDKFGNSGELKQVLYVAQDITSVRFIVTLYNDSNYNLPAANGLTYFLSNPQFTRLNVTPAPSLSVTPTPSTTRGSGTTPTPTPSATATAPHPQLFNVMARLNRFAMVDPTFENLNLDGLVNVINQTTDGKIYLGGDYTQGGNEYIFGRLNSDGTLDMSYQFNNSQIDNTVVCMKQAANGKIYVGGTFHKFMSNTSYKGMGRLNSDGTLDTTFTDIGIPVNSAVKVGSIIQTTDGKIYYTAGSGTSNYVGRLNSDGTIDGTYTNVNIAIAGTNGMFYLCQAADGKIYVGGPPQFNVGPSFTFISGGMFRLNSDGTYDPSFETEANSLFGTFGGIMQAANGKIYAYGTLGTDNVQYPNGNGLIRLNSDGTIDNSLDPSLVLLIQNSVNIKTIYQTTDGFIYLGGFISEGGNNYNYFSRLTATGVVDDALDAPTFYDEVDDIYQTTDSKIYVYGGQFAKTPNPESKILDGMGAQVSTPLIDEYYFPNLIGKLASGTLLIGNEFEVSGHYGFAGINPDGSVNGSVLQANTDDRIAVATVDPVTSKVYVGGSWNTFDGNTTYAKLVRLTAGATAIDTTFTAITLASETNTPQVNGVLFATSGKIYVIGSFDTVNGDARRYVFRLNADGTYDSTFVDPGFTLGGFDNMYGITQTADHKIYLTGSFGSTGGNNVARLNADGTLDTTLPNFGANGFNATTAFQQSTGKIYITGSFNSFGGQTYNGIARLNSNGTLDTTFIDLGLNTSSNQTVNYFVELASGKLLIFGTYYPSSSVLSPYYAIARLNADGTFDGTYNNISSFGDAINGVEVLSDGSMFITGNFAAAG